MTGRPQLELADRLAVALIEHGPCPGEQLARIVRARRTAVVAALTGDERFVRVGRGRGTRWTLALARWDGMGREDRPGSGEPVTRAEFDALRRRVARLEQRTAKPA